jgi:hypothetical protein
MTGMTGLSVAFHILALFLGLFGGYGSYTSKGGAEGGVPVLAHVFGAFVASAVGTVIQRAASLVEEAPFEPIVVALPLLLAALAYGAVLVGGHLSRRGPTNPEQR